MKLPAVDLAILVAYLAGVLVLGFFFQRRAGRSLQAYFLGGRSIPWWILGMSGSATYFDVTGTMWIVSTFYAVGMKAMWEHWKWCFPMAGVYLAFSAKWAYRSGALTAMEFLSFRFGEGWDGKVARVMTAFVALVGMTLMIGYAGIGIGKFAEVFLPWNRDACVAGIFLVTGTYVVLGGLYSVAFTDLVQMVTLSIAAVVIAAIAFVRIDPAAFARAAGEGWFSLAPAARLDVRDYGPFGALVGLWLARGLLGMAGGFGGPDFQRFRSVRSELDAARVGAMWGLAFTVRWLLVAAILLFGVTGLAAGVDREKVLPMVVERDLPVVLRGVVLAGLLAAFMSTFDSTINVASSFFVNDILRPFLPGARERALVRASYASTLAIVAIGIAVSFTTEDIRTIWDKILFTVGAAFLFPGILRLYWWRLSGRAYAASGGVVLAAAGLVQLFRPDAKELEYFPALAVLSLATAVVFAHLWPCRDLEHLERYWRTIRPFGLWGPVRRAVHARDPAFRFPARDRHDLRNAILGVAFFTALFLAPMEAMFRRWGAFAAAAGAAAFFGLLLYPSWYRPLRAEAGARVERPDPPPTAPPPPGTGRRRGAPGA